ncbi:MAG: ABC transporter substrate-binding protein, partial [Deltaproteobacteria bacterium]|nr:ABC transporter substrate-binding protein [Deltaproteobacteria bacterium]
MIFLSLCIFHPIEAISEEETITGPENSPLVICLPDDVVTMDPTMHRSRITQIVLKNIFDSLTARNEKNNVVPQLAESWRLINDTEWEFRLRNDVRFHNGQRLTASDVKFTLDRVINKDFSTQEVSPRKGLFEPVTEVTAPDDLTIRIKTGHPWPNLPLMLSLQEILPESYFKKVGSSGFNDHPVGAGPFRFVRGKRGDEIVLERFEDYYGGSSLRPPVQKAPLRQVVFKIVPSSLDQLAMLKSGKCDILFDVHPEYIAVLGMSSGIHILKIPATKSYFAEINCTRPPMNDMRVRKALNYAVDINTIIRYKLSGQGQRLSTILLPNAFGFNRRLDPYPYNTKRARELLNEAGYPYDYVISIFTNRNDLIFADSIALYLTKMGLKAQLKIVHYFRPQDTGPDAPWDIF